DLLDPLVESIDVLLQVLIQGLELAAAIGGVRWQRQRREQYLALSIPQCVATPHAVGQHDRVERVLHARPHADPLMAVQEKCSEVSKLSRRHPDRWEPILRQQLEQKRRIAAIVFLPACLRLSNRDGMPDATLD